MKKNIVNFRIILLGLICTVILTACLPKATHLNQKTYMFSVRYPGVVENTNKTTLQVNGTSINTAFSDNQFVYRTSNLTYKKDFYNIFFIPANQQVNDILIATLRHTKIVSDVEKPGTLNNVQYILKTNIDSLYADYRSAKYPKAIFVLHAELYYMGSDGNMRKLMQHNYKQNILIKPKNSRGLVTAWSKDISKILPKLVTDINTNIIKHELAKQIAADKAKAKKESQSEITRNQQRVNR